MRTVWIAFYVFASVIATHGYIHLSHFSLSYVFYFVIAWMTVEVLQENDVPPAAAADTERPSVGAGSQQPPPHPQPSHEDEHSPEVFDFYTQVCSATKRMR